MKRNRLLVVAVFAAVFAAAAIIGSVPASAGTATGSLAVSASIAAKCSVGNGALDFGAYDPVASNLTADLNGEGSFSVSCTKGTAGITVGLDLGANGGGAARMMKLASGADLLSYDLYSNSARTTVWGNSGPALYTLGNATSKAPVTLRVYGKVAAGQDVSVGSYSDTVTVTVNY